MATDLCAFKAKAKSLLDSGELSDFTVICEGKHYQVHRAILMCHSKYFDACFQSKFAEVTNGQIDLKEDPPEAIEIMMQFFYNFDYDNFDYEIDTVKDTDILLRHSMAYAVADKYQVADLKELARIKFAIDLLDCKFCCGPAATHAFESTPDTDHGLRDLCLQSFIIDLEIKGDPGYVHDDPKIGPCMALCQEAMGLYPVALMAEVLTFDLFRRVGCFKPKSPKKEQDEAAAAREALSIYLSKHKGSGRAESLRKINEKVAAMTTE